VDVDVDVEAVEDESALLDSLDDDSEPDEATAADFLPSALESVL
jgi:hypothetical protein